MYYAQIRVALIFLFFGLGILLHLRQGPAGAIYLYAAGAVLLLTYLLFGNVWGAFTLLKRGRPAEAERLLNTTRFPGLLLRRHRAYYHFSRGMIYLQRKQLEAGEQHLRQAETLGLDRPIDRALLQLNLAHIFFLRGAYERCRQHLDAAKAERTDDLLIRQHVGQLESALANLQ